MICPHCVQALLKHDHKQLQHHFLTMQILQIMVSLLGLELWKPWLKFLPSHNLLIG